MPSTKSLLILSARAVAKCCTQGVFLTCTQLIPILPLDLVQEVYDFLKPSYVERDVMAHPSSYSDYLYEEDWCRFQTIAYWGPQQCYPDSD
jgi:hypothetical protein